MPKKQKYHLFVMGCQMNLSDAERLETILNSLGYKKTNEEDEADLIGVVSCAVRQKAMDRIYGKIHKWNLIKEKRPLITILTGCVLKHDKEKLKYQFDILLDMKDIQTLPELLHARQLALGNLNPSISYLQIKPSYESDFKAYVPIMTGCNKFCTYCAVPYTRGPEISRPADEIFTELKELLNKGYKEITLLGQNVNSYGLDNKDTRSPNYKKPMLTFPQLLHEINSWRGNFWIRFMTSHPYDMSDELINVMTERKHITESIHLPVQSGNDEILKKMNRNYTVKHYLDRLTKIRKYLPEFSLSTDIIVGFCGETKQQFMDTAKLMKKVKYDMAYISEYSPRPGTGAARAYQDDIPKNEKKRREKYLTEILKNTAQEFNNKFINKTTKVLVDGIKKNINNKKLSKQSFTFLLYGKNRELKNVQFYSNKNLTGQFVDVKITQANTWNLSGEILA
jgi:tRNA-2-methylthio-N6-dimethylallyladenosine synthase